MRNRTRLVPLLAVSAIALGGCAFGPDESREDAGDITSHRCESATATGCVDKSQPRVTAFNNHFGNIEAKCDGFGHVILVTSNEHGDHVTIYPDSQCPGYDPNEVKPVVSAQR